MGVHGVCLRKRKYQNQALAQQVASQRKPKRGHRLHIYRCPFCQHWHISHANLTTVNDWIRQNRYERKHRQKWQ